ncbi:hypothetical protein H2203_002490 [Taxawa tesnikishii (nom. ined.)]|nr:hypothetical protein H2203_002490 [Dothideales sp. JES 119]
MSDIEKVLDLEVPQSIEISPSGERLIYSTSLVYGHKKGDNAVSSIWIADIDKEKSARQLTSGLFNDKAPKWAPDGKSIAFTSDRSKAGKSSAIYQLSLQGGESVPLTKADNERPIQNFVWSPDGKFIAFLSADEKTPEQKRREEEKDDAEVFGEDWEYNRVRLVHVASKTVTTLVQRDAHVADLTWSEDSKSIAFLVQKTPEFESGFTDGMDIERVSVTSKECTRICKCRGAVTSAWKATGMEWVGEHIYFSAGNTPEENISSDAVWSVSVADGKGDEECAADHNRAGDIMVIKFKTGLRDELRTLDGKVLYSEMTDIRQWHVCLLPASSDVVVALAKGTTSNPVEVFSISRSGEPVQLSDHGHAFTEPIGTAVSLSVVSADGEVELDCLFITPASVSLRPDAKPPKPQPTAVIIHGGPYHRLTAGFYHDYGWPTHLLMQGYSVLIPNYRGVRGAATWMRGGVGTVDYDDVVTMTDYCVKNGYSDPKRLIAGGWSQGGFLSYLCTTRNGAHGLGWRFRGTICGAGVTEWDMMAVESDVPNFECELGAQAPWEMAKDDVRSRRGSAVWEMAEAAAKGRWPDAVLILHGEKDVRVPLGQAWAFHRGAESGRSRVRW